MIDKIRVQIFGMKYKELSGGCGCSHGKSSCEGCGSGGDKNCKGCNSSCKKNSESDSIKTVGDVYEELKEFIASSDVKNKVQLEFIDLDKVSINEQYDRVGETIDKGFEPPITVIDNIIRYYGGISKDLVYKDVKELLE